VEAPGNCPVCSPPLNPALQVSEVLRAIIDSVHDKAIVSDVDPGSTAGF